MPSIHPSLVHLCRLGDAIRTASAVVGLTLLAAPALLLGASGFMIRPLLWVVVSLVLLPAGALAAGAYWYADRHRLWSVVYAVFAICVLGSPALTPRELVHFHCLYRAIAPGMSEVDVQKLLLSEFPQAHSEGWPRFKREPNAIVIFLNAGASRFSGECIVLPLARNGHVYSKQYQSE